MTQSCPGSGVVSALSIFDHLDREGEKKGDGERKYSKIFRIEDLFELFDDGRHGNDQINGNNSNENNKDDATKVVGITSAINMESPTNFCASITKDFLLFGGNNGVSGISSSSLDMTVEKISKMTVSDRILPVIAAYFSPSPTHVGSDETAKTDKAKKTEKTAIFYIPEWVTRAVSCRYEVLGSDSRPGELGSDSAYPPLTEGEMYVRAQLKDYLTARGR